MRSRRRRGRAPEIDRGPNATRPPLPDYPDSEIDEGMFYEYALRRPAALVDGSHSSSIQSGEKRRIAKFG
jgi:hypothetical protein